jgi:hypothetical protein
VSLQVAILKVLSSYPNGCAGVAALTADLAILGSSGSDWNDRMKRLASRAPQLDIFSQRLVLRDGLGWQLTETGRQFLLALEKSAIEAPREIEQAPPQTAEADMPMVLLRMKWMAPDRARAAIDPIRRETARALRVPYQRRFALIEGGLGRGPRRQQ